MPIYVGYTQSRRTVKFKHFIHPPITPENPTGDPELATAEDYANADPGDTRFLLCPPPTIFLHAELTDETSLANLTFTWEQIEGPIVPLANTNQLSTSYPFSEQEDKVFRFWINKGGHRESFHDLYIYHTPISLTGQCLMPVKQHQAWITAPNLVETVSPSVILDGGVEGNYDFTPVTRVSFDPVIKSGYRHSHIKMNLLSDVAYTQNPQTIIATYPVHNYPTNLILANGVYAFRLHYNWVPNKTFYDSPVFVANAFINENTIAVKTVMPAQGVSGKGRNILRLPPKVYNIADILGKLGLNGSAKNTLRLGKVLRSIDDLLPPLGLTASSKNIIRLDPSNIGNQA